MRFSRSLKLAANILLHSKLRSWLTVIGIVIGVAAVVSIISIGQGLQQSIEARLGGLGADLISISPGAGRAAGGFRGGDFGGGGGGATSTNAKNLTNKDLQVLQSINGVKVVEGIVSGRGEVYYLSEKSTISITGVDPVAWKEITTSELDSGRFLGPTDYNVVVVGNRVATRMFKQPLLLNRMITIEGKPFKIIGILKESGGFGGDDNSIIMPTQAARDTLTDVGIDKFDSIIIKADDVNNVDQLLIDIDNRLMISRHVTTRNKDYRISSAKAAQAQAESIVQTLTLFLGAIAAVSLLVGAVGIANTMFTSVLEKTKEIGVMKSIGAKNRDIMMIFLLNSGMVGMTGGLIGILFGSIISALLPTIGLRLMGGGAAGGALTTAITPSLLIMALVVSILIGVIAGVVPAYRASKLKPVDALRYE